MKKCFLAHLGCCGEDDKAVCTIRMLSQGMINPSMIGTVGLEKGKRYAFCKYHARYCGIIVEGTLSFEEMIMRNFVFV
jgi:hypothetical protein